MMKTLLTLFAGILCTSTLAETSTVPTVVPIDFSRFNNPNTGTHYLESRNLLLNATRYNLAWIKKTFKHDASQQIYLLPGTNEHSVRPATSVIYALAATLKTGIFDENVTRVSRNTALEMTKKLIRGAASAHKVNTTDGKGWGDQWQSALWAAQLGFGGFMIRDDLQPQTCQMITHIVIHEANRFIDYKVPYWNGKGGDTKAEENSWNSMILNVALMMMPNLISDNHSYLPATIRISG